MALEINYPQQTTYFICREDDTFTITAYGVVETNQCMITGQPIMDQYLDEAEWVQILIDAGIDPEQILAQGASEELMAQYITNEEAPADPSAEPGA
jgi:hypothetical protein